MKDLTIIVPAYNEEASLKVLLPELLRFIGLHGCQLIVVNDGSTDLSLEILKAHNDHVGFRYLDHKLNRGYGAAIKTGVRNAETRLVVTIDADGQHVLNDIETLYSALCQRNADMMVGDRSRQKNASIYRGLGKSLIRMFARLLLPVHIKDINSGMKICDTQLAKRYIRLCPDNMAYSDIITLVFISNRHLVLEHPIQINRRTKGLSTINTLTAIETLKEILNIVVLFNPMRIFFPIALVSIALALAWGIPIALKGRGVSTGAMLGFTTGLLFFFLGLLAEQLSQIRRDRLYE